MDIIKTLIVDDEPRIRRGIERHVEALGEGWKVVATAGDGREALELLHELNGEVDLLITDVKMPEMDGLTLIKEAKKQYSIYPFLISGFDDFMYVQTALREGALDYILKPLDRDQFRNRLIELGDIIIRDRQRSLKESELERESQKLKKTRQIQTLSYIASAEVNMTNLGYWVDEFPKGKYLLQLIRLDTLPVKSRSYTENDWKAYFFVLENIVSEVVDSETARLGQCGWCFLGGEFDFWVLTHTTETEEDCREAAFGLAEHIRSSVQAYTPFTVSVSYGAVIEDLYLLPVAKRQALAIMNNRFLFGGNQVFHMAGCPEKQDSDPFDKETTALLQKLKRAIEQGNEANALDVFKQLADRLERTEDPSKIQSTSQSTVLFIHSAWLDHRGGNAEVISIEDELQKVKKAANLQELKSNIRQLIHAVLKEIRLSRSSSDRNVLEKAQRWIHANLAEDITIKKIADQVYMNPTYFSEYFKQQTGETVLDYMTRQRIELAKSLLIETRLKLQEVSSSVGYQDVKYFSRLFKQRIGMTPTQFREPTQ